MGTEIFLGMPSARIKKWIDEHYSPGPGPEPGPTAPDGKVLYKTIAGEEWLQDDADINNGEFNGFANKKNAVEVVIPSKDSNGNDVTSIGFEAFYYCWRLKSVMIPSSVTSIGKKAFFYCINLPSVTIPNSVKTIGHSAFGYCSCLTSVIIPDSVTSIETIAFCYCSSLTSVTIPNSVTSIGNYIFKGCSKLMSITVNNGNPNYSSDNGLLLSKDGKILIQGVNGDITIPDSVTSIMEFAF